MSMKNIAAMVLVAAVAVVVLIFAFRAKTEDAGKKEDAAMKKNEPTAPLEIRKPAYAGQFYKADKAGLDADVAGYLAKAKKRVIADDVVEILVPHAGYAYSAPTAAAAYKTLEGKKFDLVILLGSPHKYPEPGGFVYSGGAFETPLGNVSVDFELAQALASTGVVKSSSEAHANEHSLEVQIPFLQKTLKDFKILPILVRGDAETLEKIANAIWTTLHMKLPCNKKVLIVVSTDLAHYPAKADAEKSDSEILDTFAALDAGKLAKKDEELMKRGIKNLDCAMCAVDAAYVGVRLANMLKADKAEIIMKSTSADAGVEGADEGRVVGYGAALVTRKKPEPDRVIDEACSKKLIEVARKTLIAAVKGEKPPQFNFADADLQKKFGVFVTLKNKGDGELRGCIGRFEGTTEIYKLVSEVTVDSATRDSRFFGCRIKESELDNIKIEISLLSPLTPVNGLDEIVLGKHGVYAVFGGGAGRATFLPQVATETGWSLEEFMEELSQKAGLERTAWKNPGTKISVYTCQIIDE
jgi:hypothetical protein